MPAPVIHRCTFADGGAQDICTRAGEASQQQIQKLHSCACSLGSGGMPRSACQAEFRVRLSRLALPLPHAALPCFPMHLRCPCLGFAGAPPPLPWFESCLRTKFTGYLVFLFYIWRERSMVAAAPLLCGLFLASTLPPAPGEFHRNSYPVGILRDAEHVLAPDWQDCIAGGANRKRFHAACDVAAAFFRK